MRRLLLCLALLCGVAVATTYQKLTLEQQVERAEIVVRGVIKDASVEMRGKRPWTIYSLELKAYLRGETPGLTKTGNLPSFAVLGGANLRLEGAPSFKPGEEWVLLLYAQAFDSPIVGFRQGAYRLDNDRVFDADGKAVSLTVDGKTVPATTASFLARLEALIGGQK